MSGNFERKEIKKNWLIPVLMAGIVICIGVTIWA